ncbi:MAG: hypothetical protein EOP08_11700 [Proteobacteria bacterium]|nr:MAG: hypothetical protein EOP08_11700 [Pseudomonadota bacterium]
MLRDLLKAEQPVILARFQKRAYEWSAPDAVQAELTAQVSLFVQQLERLATSEKSPSDNERHCAAISSGAAKHAQALLQYGFPLAQAVNDYGDVCRVISEVARERGAPLSDAEVEILSLGSVSAILAAAEEYGPRAVSPYS